MTPRNDSTPATDTFERALTADRYLASSTIRTYVADVARWETWCRQQRPGVDIRDATVEDIIDYLHDTQQNTSVHTRRRIVIAIRTFYRHCGRPDGDNPGHAIPLPRPPKPNQPALYTMEELETMMDLADMRASQARGAQAHQAYRDATIVDLHCLYPLRTIEIANAKLTDLNEKWLHVPSKTGGRQIPIEGIMHQRLEAFLANHRPHLGDSPLLFPTGSADPRRYLARLLARHATDAGIPGPHTTHNLRLSVILALADSEMPIPIVTYLAGMSWEQMMRILHQMQPGQAQIEAELRRHHATDASIEPEDDAAAA